MRSLAHITSDIEGTNELKGLVEVYEELAAITMQRLRGDTVSAREFFESLANLSKEVQADIRSTSNATAPEAAVLLSANGGLFGNIVDAVFVEFIAYIREHPESEVVIVGDMGVTLFKQVFPDKPYHMISVPDDTLPMDVFRSMLTSLSGYGALTIFYGKFGSIVSQTPAMLTVSGALLASVARAAGENKSVSQYIYEPTLPEISDLFAQEIMTSIMEQSVRESQLSKYASRLMALDESLDGIDTRLTSLNREKLSAHKHLEEKKQMMRVVGASLALKGAV